MIHPTYTLDDLLKFWQRQMDDEFKVIEAIVNTWEYKTERLTKEQKLEIILQTLRDYGLYEIGYKGDRNFILKQKSREIPLPEDHIPNPGDEVNYHPNGIEVPMELYNIRLLNHLVQFQNIMN